jgi:hypothetical protein
MVVLERAAPWLWWCLVAGVMGSGNSSGGLQTARPELIGNNAVWWGEEQRRASGTAVRWWGESVFLFNTKAGDRGYQHGTETEACRNPCSAVVGLKQRQSDGDLSGRCGRLHVQACAALEAIWRGGLTGSVGCRVSLFLWVGLFNSSFSIFKFNYSNQTNLQNMKHALLSV